MVRSRGAVTAADDWTQCAQTLGEELCILNSEW